MPPTNFTFQHHGIPSSYPNKQLDNSEFNDLIKLIELEPESIIFQSTQASKNNEQYFSALPFKIASLFPDTPDNRSQILNVASVRQNSIEALRSERGSCSPTRKGDKENCLVEVQASPHAKFESPSIITLNNHQALSTFTQKNPSYVDLKPTCDPQDNETLEGLGIDRIYELLLEHQDPRMMIRRLIKRGFDIDAKNEDGKTLLHLAMIRGSYLILKILIMQDCYLDPRDNNDLTPLMWIAMLPENPDRIQIADFLLKSGARVDYRDRLDRTALMIANDASNRKIAELIDW